MREIPKSFPWLKRLFAGVCVVAALLVNTWGQAVDRADGKELTSLPDGVRAFPLATPANPAESAVGFRLRSSDETGVHFANYLDEAAGAANRTLWNGSGVAVGDVNGDGRLDLFFCGLQTPNRLYLNLGNWKFEDGTSEAGLEFPTGFYRGAVFADLDGDRDLDLVVSGVGLGARVYLNDGAGKFTDFSQEAGMAGPFGTMTIALADIDRDGDLDVYLVNNRSNDIRDEGSIPLSMRNGEVVVSPRFQNRLIFNNGKIQEYGEPDLLFINDGAGHFKPLPWHTGIFLDETGKALPKPPLDWGLSAAFQDINQDGFPDIYVCNDYWTPDRIWLNQGNGTFQSASSGQFRHLPASSMGVDFSDIDRDGLVDILAVDMLSRDPRLRIRQMPAQDHEDWNSNRWEETQQYGRNMLYWNRGDGTFAEIAHLAGLAASDWSWTPMFMDVDLDGYEDLLISAGHFKNVQDRDAAKEVLKHQVQFPKGASPLQKKELFAKSMLENNRRYPDLQLPVVAFRNQRDLKFREATEDWGLGDHVGVNHGMARGDLDGDGDLDLVVNRLGSNAALFENKSTAPRLAVRLVGQGNNSSAIGARIELRNGEAQFQSDELDMGGRYLSGSDSMAVFATGGSSTKTDLAVHWPNGKKSEFQDLIPGYMYVVQESESHSTSIAHAETSALNETKPWFRKQITNITEPEKELEFDDFRGQTTLPWKLSDRGAALAWMDLDRNGTEELWVGGGRGAALSAHEREVDSEGVAQFKQVGNLIREKVFLQNDLAGFAIVSSPSDSNKSESPSHLITGFKQYESPSPLAVSWWEIQQNKSGDPKILWKSEASEEPEGLSKGPIGGLATADYDADGDLDLWVGGGVLPGGFPFIQPGQLFLREGAAWKLDKANSELLKDLPHIAAALWSDLNGDGFPELILAPSWGALRIFQNNQGTLSEISESIGTLNRKSWWTALSAGDWNGDGRIDIALGSIGLNQPFSDPGQPELVWYYQRNGSRVDWLETRWDRWTKSRTFSRPFEIVAQTAPAIYRKFRSYREYSEADVEAVLPDLWPDAIPMRINHFESGIYWNNGKELVWESFPVEAQMAPVWDIRTLDADMDGREDLWMTQNTSGLRTEFARIDAGRGVLLSLNKNGRGWENLVSSVSGLDLPEEARNAVVGDWNQDLRPDLVVAIKGGRPILFENQMSKQGIQVTLNGPPGNPHGIGAMIRLRTKSGMGPAREIRSGGGSGALDTVSPILGNDETPEYVWVRWPGGRVGLSRVQPDASQRVSVDWSAESIGGDKKSN